MATAEVDKTKTDNGTALAKAAPPKREILVVEDTGPLAHIFDTARFEQLQRVATILADGSLTPKHLLGQTRAITIANCFRVANQAIRWEMDPFAVADETYVVSGKLGYQGKLVAAVINARAKLKGRLAFEFKGLGEDRTVIVSGMFRDEDKIRTVELSVKQAKTDNKMWTKDPDQKLVYSGVTKWARRHCPEVILGILTDDDLERIQANTIDVESGPSTLDDLADRLLPRTEEVEAKSEPTAQGQTLESLTLDELFIRLDRAGCPPEDVGQWAGKAQEQQDPTAFIAAKPWAKKGKPEQTDLLDKGNGA